MADSTADIGATAAATGDDGAPAHPAAVKRGATTMSVTVVLLALLVASVAVFLVSSPHHAGSEVGKRVEQGAGEEGGKRRAGEPVEHAVGIPGFNSRLDAFRAWARLAWTKLRRPRSDEPRHDEPGSASAVAGAAKKSFEMGKETVEQAAATAGMATGEAVEKAKRAAIAADDDED